MTAFAPPFDPVSVIRQTDVVAQFTNPPRTQTDPIRRPRVARYASSRIILLHVLRNANMSFTLSSPAKGTVRTVDIVNPLPGAVSQLLEISLLPFGIENVLGSLPHGAPTFYLGYRSTGGIPAPADHDLVDQELPFATNVDEAYLGVLFQDRVALAPWGWIELIRRAMEMSNDSSGATSWNNLASLYTGIKSLRTLDHLGMAAPNQNFQIRIRNADGTFEGPWIRSSGNNSDLELTVNDDPLPRASGAQHSLFSTLEEQVELRWVGDPPPGDVALPIHSLYESEISNSKPPGEAILLDEGVERAHLQIMELARWFASRSPGSASEPPGNFLARYQLNSRVEPIIDGTPFFKLLVNDLLHCNTQDTGAHFAGWAFNEFPLDSHRNDSVDTTLTALVRRIMDQGGEVRFLVNKFIKFKSDAFDTEAKRVAALFLILLTFALLLFSIFGAFETSMVGFMILMGGFVLVPELIDRLFSASEIIEGIVEQSQEIFPLLNDIKDRIAVWSTYPAKLADNPIAITPLPLNLDQHIEQFGVYHQKFQLIKRATDQQNDPNQFVGYLGGIDVNINRLDTPSHSVVHPYHDIHARITGPGAADIFKSWEERYTYERKKLSEAGIESLEPAFVSPTPTSLEVQSAKHIVQVARTYFKPHPTTSESERLDFAKEGEKLIHDTLVRAIRSAKEYIYIEDQYFTPNDGSAETLFEALVTAASQEEGRLRLVIIVPSETSLADQPFGDLRKKYLFDRLTQAWGDRVLIGTPLRKPILANPGRLASEGRCYLMRDMAPTTANGSDTIYIGPQSRVPKKSPFWLWIDGELMISSGEPRPKDIDGEPLMEVEVLRGSAGTNPRWGANTVKHIKGSTVTLAQLKGIFVHSKIMMVDDLFVSIGSANLNRRGLFHDGEINVFAVPEQLKSAPDNPALALRTSLWAEHLGIAPSMGRSLLSDPIAAFDLFLRSRYVGNRFTRISALDLKPYLAVPTTDTYIMQAAAATIIGWANTLIPIIWNDLTDPTSFSDPSPTRGPEPES